MREITWQLHTTTQLAALVVAFVAAFWTVLVKTAVDGPADDD
jgi:hypothetical protein